MADDLVNRGPAHARRISLHEAHEVTDWTNVLDITEDEVAAAFEKAGPMAKDGRTRLGE